MMSCASGLAKEITSPALQSIRATEETVVNRLLSLSSSSKKKIKQSQFQRAEETASRLQFGSPTVLLSLHPALINLPIQHKFGLIVAVQFQS